MSALLPEFLIELLSPSSTSPSSTSPSSTSPSSTSPSTSLSRFRDAKYFDKNVIGIIEQFARTELVIKLGPIWRGRLCVNQADTNMFVSFDRKIHVYDKKFNLVEIPFGIQEGEVAWADEKCVLTTASAYRNLVMVTENQSYLIGRYKIHTLNDAVIDPMTGMIYVADGSTTHKIFVFNKKRELVFQFGERGEDPGQLYRPHRLAIEGDRLYVLEEYNHRVSVFSIGGEFLFCFGSFGSENENFYNPSGICLSAKEIIIADTGNNCLKIWSKEGEYLRSYGQIGSKVGQFWHPIDVRIYKSKYIAVLETGNSRLQILDWK